MRVGTENRGFEPKTPTRAGWGFGRPSDRSSNRNRVGGWELYRRQGIVLVHPLPSDHGLVDLCFRGVKVIIVLFGN